MEGHRRCEQFRVGIPPLDLAFAKEWVEVRWSANRDVIRGRACQGKIKQAKLLALLGLSGPNSDVLRFNITMRDSLRVEMLDGTKEILAKLFEHCEVQGPFLTQLTREGEITRVLHRESVELTEFIQIHYADDLRPVEPFEQLEFTLDPAVNVS